MTRRRLRTAALAVAGLIAVAAMWEFYKLVGPDRGGEVFGWAILPRANDNVMPHVWEMFARFGDPERRGSDRQIWQTVLGGSWFTFRIALLGFVIAAVVGTGLAVLMARFRFVERGLLPYLVVSQTVPLIALAPLVVSWGGRVQVGDWVWPRWLSAAVLGAFLGFFPVAVGTMRGLKSSPPAAMELMDSYAASWRESLFKLRFPAAVPQIVPALKLAATASVVGVVVAEISTGLQGGIGRLVIEYARQATSDPAKVYTAVFGAAAVGLAMAGLVGLLDRLMMRGRPPAEPDIVMGATT